jgi:hypothetical protein
VREIRETARHEPTPTGAGRTPKTLIIVGATLGFLGWLLTWFWPNLKHDLFPKLRDPIRVAVAVGWADKLPEAADTGPCRPESATPPGMLSRRSDADAYETPKRGDVEIACEHRQLVLEVRRAARVTVAAPERLKRGETATVKMQVYDMNGVQLRLGDLARVVWRLEGPIASVDTRLPSAPTIRGDAAGEGTVIAEFDTLTARATIRVE